MIRIELKVKVGRKRPRRVQQPSDMPQPMQEWAPPPTLGFEPVENRAKP